MARRSAPEDMFLESFRALVPKYLEDPWAPEEGYSRQELDALLADSELPPRTRLPLVLDEFHRALGRCEEIMEAHHFFFDPDELTIEDGRLIFLEDEEERWVWGIAVDSLEVPDPLIQRRNNDKDEWSEEGATVSEFIFDLLEFSFEPEEPEPLPGRSPQS